MFATQDFYFKRNFVLRANRQNYSIRIQYLLKIIWKSK